MKVRRFISFLSIFFIVSAYAFADSFSPVWPPPPDATTYEITVVAHDWHTFIIVPPLPDEPSYVYKEYGFAEEGWYLEGKRGFKGVLRALFIPSPSLVAVRTTGPHPLLNYPSSELRVWKFRITEDGLEDMERYMKRWFDANDVLAIHGTTKYYRGTRPYHLLCTCHHFTAASLKRAGIPTDPSWAFSERLIAAQLDRITEDYRNAGEPE